MTPAQPVHENLLEFFEDYDYHRPKVEPRRLSIREQDNVVGHQQRCVTTWWALRQCGPLDLGIDVGSHRGLTPYCIHVDSMYTGAEHPIYGGRATADVVANGADLNALFPPATFPLIASNHSLEHMPELGDKQIVAMLERWFTLLRVGGVMVFVIPDNAYFDVLASDRDHKHAWSHDDFKPRVLEPLLTNLGSKLQLVEYDTLHNHFSFDLVLRRVA